MTLDLLKCNPACVNLKLELVMWTLRCGGCVSCVKVMKSRKGVCLTSMWALQRLTARFGKKAQSWIMRNPGAENVTRNLKKKEKKSRIICYCTCQVVEGVAKSHHLSPRLLFYKSLYYLFFLNFFKQLPFKCT